MERAGDEMARVLAGIHDEVKGTAGSLALAEMRVAARNWGIAKATGERDRRMAADTEERLAAIAAPRAVPCPHLVDGACPHHNLHCAYPACMRPADARGGDPRPA